jgi:hypothetical protein
MALAGIVHPYPFHQPANIGVNPRNPWLKCMDILSIGLQTSVAVPSVALSLPNGAKDG